jgi:hypothetical protein
MRNIVNAIFMRKGMVLLARRSAHRSNGAWLCGQRRDPPVPGRTRRFYCGHRA